MERDKKLILAINKKTGDRSAGEMFFFVKQEKKKGAIMAYLPGLTRPASTRNRSSTETFKPATPAFSRQPSVAGSRMVRSLPI